MKAVKRLLKNIDYIASDLLQILKVMIAPVCLYSVGTVTLAVAFLVAYSVNGQSGTGIDMFLAFMNLTGSTLRVELRSLLLTFNWFTIFAGMIWMCSCFVKYLSDVNYKITLEQKVQTRKKLNLVKLADIQSTGENKMTVNS
jgi:hypothetical protein